MLHYEAAQSFPPELPTLLQFGEHTISTVQCAHVARGPGKSPGQGKPGAVQWGALRGLSAAADHAPDRVQVGAKRCGILVCGFQVLEQSSAAALRCGLYEVAPTLPASKRAVPKLKSEIDVVKFHERGSDWGLRDFDPASVPLSKATGGQPTAARARVIAELQSMEARGGLPEILKNVLSKLTREPPSDNIHWSPSTGKILIIDMQ